MIFSILEKGKQGFFGKPMGVTKKQLVWLAEVILPNGKVRSPAFADVLADILEQADDARDARKLLKILVPGRPFADKYTDALLLADPATDIMLSSFAQIFLKAGKADPHAFKQALQAGSEVSGLEGFRLSIPLHIAITGLAFGFNLEHLCLFLGAKEVTTRIYAAINYIREDRETDEGMKIKPRPATTDEIEILAEYILPSEFPFSENLKKYFAGIVGLDADFIFAADLLSILIPGPVRIFGEVQNTLVHKKELDVALLCFAEIFLKAGLRKEDDAFKKAERAALEVTGISRSAFERTLRVAITGRTESVNLPFTAGALGPKEVAERIKSAIDVISKRKIRDRKTSSSKKRKGEK